MTEPNRLVIRPLQKFRKDNDVVYYHFADPDFIGKQEQCYIDIYGNEYWLDITPVKIEGNEDRPSE